MKLKNFLQRIKRLVLPAAAAAAIMIGSNVTLAQTSSTVWSNCIATPFTNIVCQTVTSNLPATMYNTNNVYQRHHLGIGMYFCGGASTNTCTIGFQFAVRSKNNGVVTTTKPFTINSTANGTTAVLDWGVIPDYNLGPADAIVLTGITNAFVNSNPGFPAGSVNVSNVWLQLDTGTH